MQITFFDIAFKQFDTGLMRHPIFPFLKHSFILCFVLDRKQLTD